MVDQPRMNHDCIWLAGNYWLGIAGVLVKTLFVEVEDTVAVECTRADHNDNYSVVLMNCLASAGKIDRYKDISRTSEIVLNLFYIKRLYY